MTNHRIFLGFCIALLISTASPAQTRIDQPIVMNDGVSLDATIVLPSGAVPAGGYPGIVLIHGFGGSKDEMLPVSALLVSRGYASITYSVRGQGNSGGFSSVLGERERQDLREVVRYFRSLANIDSNHIGVTGASQGGIHSWMAAVDRIPGVVAVAPLLATPDFALALAPNGCVRYGLTYEMSLSSVRYGADRDRVKGFIIADQYDSVLAYVSQRNLMSLLDSVQVPVFQELGWADYLFPVNGGIDAAAALTARDIPVRSYYGTNGHGEPTNSQEITYQLDQTFQWFDRWLKGLPLAQDSLPLVTYADDRPTWPHHTTTTWPPDPHQTVRFYLTGSRLSTALPVVEGMFPFSLTYNQTFTPEMAWDSHYSGTQFISAFSSVPATFVSAPLSDSVEITGVPSGLLRVSSDAPKFQVHIQICDVVGSNWKIISRSSHRIRGDLANNVTDIQFETAALSHIVPAGHSLGVIITSFDTLRFDQANTVPFFVTSHSSVISQNPPTSYIDLPIVGTSTIASLTPIPEQPGPGFRLEQNWPNPFNPTTTIKYTVGVAGGKWQVAGGAGTGGWALGARKTTVTIYDVLGRQVATLVDAEQLPGSYEVRFDGRGLSSGVYYYRLTIGSLSQTRTMILVK